MVVGVADTVDPVVTFKLVAGDQTYETAPVADKLITSPMQIVSLVLLIEIIGLFKIETW